MYPDGCQTIGMPVDEPLKALANNKPRALALYYLLRAKYPLGMPFTCPVRKAKADFNMDGKTLGRSLNHLKEAGLIVRLHKGGRFSPEFARRNDRLPDYGDVALYVMPPAALKRAS